MVFLVKPYTGSNVTSMAENSILNPIIHTPITVWCPPGLCTWTTLIIYISELTNSFEVFNINLIC